MEELARVMTQKGSVYVYEEADSSLVKIAYAPYGLERIDIACITHTDDTVKTVTTTTEAESFYEDVYGDDWNFVTCDEITGYVGAWLEADTSDIPVEAVKHLQEACIICSKELEKPLEEPMEKCGPLEKFKDDIHYHCNGNVAHRFSDLRKTLLKEGVAVNSGEYEMGMLIPMYHGSETIIGGFSQDKMNCGVMGEGVYFTSVFEEACDYAINALDIIEERPGSYLWNGERYEYGCLCEELEEKGYVKSYYLLIEDNNDITRSKYGNGGVVAVARDVRQIFPRNLY